MSRIRRIELVEPYTYPSSVFLRETSIFAPKTLAFPSPLFDDLEDCELGFGVGLDIVSPSLGSPFELFDNVTDLIRVEKTPSFSSYRRIQRVERLGGEVFFLERLSDRVSELESHFYRLARVGSRAVAGDRKYSWTAEIKAPAAKHGGVRKYKLTAEIRDGRKEKKEQKAQKTYKWTAEIEGKGSDDPISRTYTFKAYTGDGGECSESKKKEKKKKKSEKGENGTRLVVIEEPAESAQGAVVLRQAFAQRSKNDKGKKKELSPQDAAMMIQMSFRAYLIRRSQALRALRDLAVAKTKLKEIRALFNNFSYRRLVARDAEERQRFTERIIVLLLTVDAIEAADLMVRAAKGSMVDELEAMLDVVDPQPTKKSLSMRRRTFDMPDGVIQKEIAAGVAEVVQMLNHDENISNTFEACL